MAKKTGELALASLDDELLLVAYGRNGCVLRPYPENVERAKVDEAIARLREKGFVHGSQREPNLTMKGIASARDLLEQAA